MKLPAHRLTEARKTAAVMLDQAVMAELAPLKMDRAVFATRGHDGHN